MRKIFKKRITREEAYYYGKKLGIDFRKLKKEEWNYALLVEIEHSIINKKTNVTNNDIMLTAKIALAHIMEYPNYYKYLKEMERELEKEWKGKTKRYINKKIFI